MSLKEQAFVRVLVTRERGYSDFALSAKAYALTCPFGKGSWDVPELLGAS